MLRIDTANEAINKNFFSYIMIITGVFSGSKIILCLALLLIILITIRNKGMSLIALKSGCQFINNNFIFSGLFLFLVVFCYEVVGSDYSNYENMGRGLAGGIRILIFCMLTYVALALLSVRILVFFLYSVLLYFFICFYFTLITDISVLTGREINFITYKGVMKVNSPGVINVSLMLLMLLYLINDKSQWLIVLAAFYVVIAWQLQSRTGTILSIPFYLFLLYDAKNKQFLSSSICMFFLLVPIMIHVFLIANVSINGSSEISRSIINYGFLNRIYDIGVANKWDLGLYSGRWEYYSVFLSDLFGFINSFGGAHLDKLKFGTSWFHNILMDGYARSGLIGVFLLGLSMLHIFLIISIAFKVKGLIIVSVFFFLWLTSIPFSSPFLLELLLPFIVSGRQLPTISTNSNNQMQGF